MHPKTHTFLLTHIAETSKHVLTHTHLLAGEELALVLVDDSVACGYLAVVISCHRSQRVDKALTRGGVNERVSHTPMGPRLAHLQHVASGLPEHIPTETQFFLQHTGNMQVR